MYVFLAFVSTWAHEIPKLPLMRLLKYTTFSKGNPEIALTGPPHYVRLPICPNSNSKSKSIKIKSLISD